MENKNSEEQKRELSNWLIELSVDQIEKDDRKKIEEKANEMQKLHFTDFNNSILIPVIRKKGCNFENLSDNLQKIISLKTMKITQKKKNFYHNLLIASVWSKLDMIGIFLVTKRNGRNIKTKFKI